jgi:hypothetical protein
MLEDYSDADERYPCLEQSLKTVAKQYDPRKPCVFSYTLRPSNQLDRSFNRQWRFDLARRRPRNDRVDSLQRS